ncbi:hypothetical protein ABZ897_61735 [Nonomuraea sp. NPDC046802]|uniref:hypothetical protein n=1 Tax=Nonomuraea sp. NPDC046802 TaxID=3154919 RepID=UPI0033F7491E
MTTDHPRPDGARRCAAPFCRKTLPPDATPRRRYCSGACRQAAWRIDNPAAIPQSAPIAPEELQALEDAVRRRAAHLAVHAQHIADPLAGTGKQAVALRTLPALVEDLLAAHVAARRAAGDTWEWIGQTLTMHPDTARRRFGQQADAGHTATTAHHDEHQDDDGPVESAPADVNDGQALTEASAEGLDEQDAPAVPPAPQQARPVDQEAPAAPVSELYLVRLDGENALLLADGARAGWLHAAPDGWQVHDRDGRLVTTLPADDAHGHDVLTGLTGLNVARPAAAALDIPGAERAAVTTGPLTDARGRALDVSPADLASWSLLKGREPGRTDVIVRGRCVGWLQRDDRGRDVACTLDGPVPGSASTNRVQAVTALLAALIAPAPLPDLGPEARKPRRPRARSPQERPISLFTPAQLAAAALADNLPRLPDGSYRVHIHDDGYDDIELGRVYRSGRRWQALNPDGRVVVHRASTRTEAVDQLLATPGPLFGDPADTVLHDL